MMEIDLAPRGRTMVDLLGRARPEEWREGAACYASWLEPECQERSRCALLEADRFAGQLSAEECRSFLTGLGIWLPGFEMKRRDLRLRVAIELHARWFPNHYLNAKVTQ